jgi:hypothetical protein
MILLEVLPIIVCYPALVRELPIVEAPKGLRGMSGGQRTCLAGRPLPDRSSIRSPHRIPTFEKLQQVEASAFSREPLSIPLSGVEPPTETRPVHALRQVRVRQRSESMPARHC